MPTVSPASMTRASISSLVNTAAGKSLLWIHIVLMFWVTLTWFGALLWICKGLFYFRALQIQAAVKRTDAQSQIRSHDAEKPLEYHPHPHPQYGFQGVPTPTAVQERGLRLRTVMVENVPPALRSERQLKEYFEFYMSRPINAPGLGLTTGMQPGFFNKFSSFLFNSFKRTDRPDVLPVADGADGMAVDRKGREHRINAHDVPAIERVTVARKFTELAAQLQRREDVLRRLETAHIKLANKVLVAVKLEMDNRAAVTTKPGNPRTSSQVSMATMHRHDMADSNVDVDVEAAQGTLSEAQRMDLLVRVLGPYVEEFDVIHEGRIMRSGKAVVDNSKWALHKLHLKADKGTVPTAHKTPLPAAGQTIWGALLGLPRNVLDPYQPLIKLARRFNAPTVPSIDYYTAKLAVLTKKVHEGRSKHPTEYDPVSTAFVTFANPHDARRACKFLAVHPSNPLACLVTMAPGFEDIDWYRVMKSTFRAEFVKDWVVDFLVWLFTIFWLFPVSLLVGLVSIQSIGQFWPGLAKYLSDHPWEEEIIQSFVPTVLVSILTLCIPPIHLLIAKKAHTIVLLSALHDKILTRYYKFLVCNIVIFFCVGTAALPLIMYPSTKRQVTPRKRAIGIHWLPNHMLIIHIMVLFAVLNPLVIPFGFIYFCVENAVIRNELVHVYAKNYEGDGRVMIIRIIRYSCDGLMVSQIVFLAYMVVLKKTVNVALSVVLLVLTVAVKLSMTRLCRAQMEDDDIAEANVVCGLVQENNSASTGSNVDLTNGHSNHVDPREGSGRRLTQKFRTLRLPAWINFSYSTMPQRVQARHPNPFGPHGHRPPFSRLGSLTSAENGGQAPTTARDPGTSFQPEIPFPSSKYPDFMIEHASSQFVSSHPPTTTWDDNSHDTPYDNPYYTRAISDTLWLPRDPFGLLDLDETVDLKVSLTSDMKSGHLDEWQEKAETYPVDTVPPTQQPTITTTPAEDEVTSSEPPTKQLTGDDIELPSGIASRVANLEQEDDIEIEKPSAQHRPSILNRQTSQSSKRSQRPISPHSTSELVRPRLNSHAWSSNSGARDSRAPSSYMSAPMSVTEQRGRVTSVTQGSVSGAGTEPAAQKSSASQVLSQERLPTGEAMKLLAEQEEREAAAEHQRAEKEEVEQSTGRKSFFTRWIYNRIH
ncbi:hypothetical protein HWV62_33457 [Athelia sp. TMB]|nr:hypothetical protein HWV62_33457 [Athelia sp. TMB]